jgi:transcriptional regulator with XRE-family HTH domain
MYDTNGRPSLAARVERLFDQVRPEGRSGRRYTNEEVGDAVGVSGAYLSALRNGTRRNPSREVLTGLARFFGVQRAYFEDDATADQTEAEIALARAMANHGVRVLAMRALELSPEALAAVAQIVEEQLSQRQTLDGSSDM